MAVENKTMTAPLVVGAVMFLLLWFVLSMSFFGSLVASVAAAAIAHFALGNRSVPEDDAPIRSAAPAAETAPEPEAKDEAEKAADSSTPPAGEEK